MAKFVETRLIDPDKVAAECIGYHWFTRATSAEYGKFLDRVYSWQGHHVNISQLKWMVEQVIQYSDPATYEGMDTVGIMFVFANRCCTLCFKEVKDNE